MAPSDLRDLAAEAADAVQAEEGKIRVVSHYDADGLSAGAIVATALRRAGKPFVLSIAKRLTSRVAEEIEGQGDLYIFCDMGSGDPGLLSEIARDTIVLDHHSPAEANPFRVDVNAHRVGVDGTYEASAASVAFGFAVALDEANWDLFPLALAGVVGDRQDRPQMQGYNAELCAEAVKRGVVDEETAPRLPPGPLAEAVAGAVDPFFVGLGGDVDAAAELLSSLGVDPEATWDELDEEARRDVASTLVARLIDQGCRPDVVRELIGTRYRFDHRGIFDAATLAGLLNAAGRSDRIGDGLAFLLGQDDVIDDLQAVERRYRERVLEEAVRVAGTGAETREAIQVVTVDEPNLAGTVAGIAMNCILDQDKATVAVRPDEPTTKISTRGTRWLVEQGLDLAEGCRVAAEEAGGSGGGHTIAAGASVPPDDLETFLSALDRVVGRQLGQGSP